MELDINWIAIVVATAVGMAIAGVWYGNWGFVRVWRDLTGVTPEDSKRTGKRPFVVLLGCLLVTAIGLAATYSIASDFLGSDSAWLGAGVGFAAWLGLSATTLTQHNAFEQKPTRLTVINNSYQLVLFLGMGLIIGLLH